MCLHFALINCFIFKGLLDVDSPGAFHDMFPPSQPKSSDKTFPLNLFEPVTVYPEEKLLLNETERNAYFFESMRH